MRWVAAGAVALALAPAPARAHELWLQREGDALVLRSGHRGGALVPVDPARVTALRCARGGAVRDVRGAARPDGPALRAAVRCDAASALLDRGTITLTPDGEVSRPRSQVPDAVRAWESRRLAKWVDARSPAAAAPLGDELELVPVTDLARARRGSALTVRVLHRGAPVAGAAVAVGHHAAGVTGAAGEARVEVQAAAVESVRATLRRRLTSPDADQVVLEASLTFEVAP